MFNSTRQVKEMDAGEEEQLVEMKAQALMWNHTLALVNSFVLKCAVELRVADIMKTLGQHPISLSKLAAALPAEAQPVNTGCLSRTMRYLVHMGLFTAEMVQGEPCYGFTPATKFMLWHEKKSMAPFVLLQVSKSIVEPYEALRTCLLEGKGPAFDAIHGANLWGYVSQHPDHNRLFNEAMASDAELVSPALIRGCKELFMGIGSLVDVGGGTGTALKAIAKAFPHIKCTIFDLPHVIETLVSEPTIQHIAGDMFSSVPPADAIMLMWILHDWTDEDCIKILKRCKEAIPQEGGKVIIVDVVIGIDAGQELTQARLALDMVMMVHTGGKERTEEEWRKLLVAAGFSRFKITPIIAVQSVIEASP